MTDPRIDPRRDHWERIYTEKDPAEVSWRQDVPTLSLTLIDEALRTAAPSTAPHPVVDVGAGASTLADHLAQRPDIDLTVVDIAQRALDHARARLADRAGRVRWIRADVAAPMPEMPDDSAEVWHDRAAFHFLTEPADRAVYAANLARVLRPGGAAIIAAFANDGPERCSGLPVHRHDGASLAAALSTAAACFDIERVAHETHHTPWGAPQRFVYALLRRQRQRGNAGADRG